MSSTNPRNLPEDASLFHILIESIKDYAIFAIDAEGRIATWNSGAERIKGYSAAEVIGKPYSIFFSPEQRASGEPARLLAEAARNGQVRGEGWRVRRDGSRFRANILLTAVYGADGQVVGYSKVTRDVTEPRAAEEALRTRERQLLDTQDLAGLGSWEWDMEADRVTWTDKLYEIYGLNRTDFGATLDTYLACVHPDDRARVQELIERAAREGGTFAFEERIVRPDSSVRVLRSRGRGIKDAAGRVVRLTGACLDITEVKQAERQALELVGEQAARAAAEAYAAGLRFLTHASELLASSLDYEETLRTVAALAVPEIADWCVVDLVAADDSLRRVAVVHVDPAKGVHADELAQRDPSQRGADARVWRVIDTGLPELQNDITDEMLVSGAVDAEDLALIRELGWRSVITVPLAGRSSVLGALTVVQAASGRSFTEQDAQILQELGRHAGLAIDNARLHREVEGQNALLASQTGELALQTEELRLQAERLEELMAELEISNEELLERTAEAEEANRAKSDFLATMSHELRTPLNAIFGYADLLDLGLHGPITAPQHEALERIKRNQRALLVLINDVLNFAKLEAGKLEIRIEEVDVTDIVAYVGMVIAPQIQTRGMNYQAGAVPEGIRVLGERERVEQILLNLLTNAVKFTPAEGSIRLDVVPLDDRVQLRVADSGNGIAADRLATVFDPFVQIDRQPQDDGERGVGLGLAISRDLAHAMNGTLSVDSEPGRGSTFTLSLPRAP